MARILNTIGEEFAPRARELLAGHDVVYHTPLQSELSGALLDCDAVICGLGLRFDAGALAVAEKLKVIATATTGVDHIDLKFAASRGIEIISLKDDRAFLDSITGTAELAIGLMIDLMRFTPFAFEDVRAGRWQRENFRGRTLFGKTLGVVGAGRLGAMVMRYGSVFGMNIVFTDPTVDAVSGVDSRRVSLRELLRTSDVVSLHTHLTEETRSLINADALAQMKKDANLVNTARGGIVDEVAVLAALQTGQIAGYATDVLSDETQRESGVASHPLVRYSRSHRNCIVVPHIGGMTVESREATDVRIAQKLIARWEDTSQNNGPVI